MMTSPRASSVPMTELAIGGFNFAVPGQHYFEALAAATIPYNAIPGMSLVTLICSNPLSLSRDVTSARVGSGVQPSVELVTRLRCDELMSLGWPCTLVASASQPPGESIDRTERMRAGRSPALK